MPFAADVAALVTPPHALVAPAQQTAWTTVTVRSGDTRGTSRSSTARPPSHRHEEPPGTWWGGHPRRSEAARAHLGRSPAGLPARRPRLRSPGPHRRRSRPRRRGSTSCAPATPCRHRRALPDQPRHVARREPAACLELHLRRPADHHPRAGCCRQTHRPTATAAYPSRPSKPRPPRPAPRLSPRAGPGWPRCQCPAAPRRPISSGASGRTTGSTPSWPWRSAGSKSGWYRHAVSSHERRGGHAAGHRHLGLAARRPQARPLDVRDNITARVLVLRALQHMAESKDQAIAAYYQGFYSVRSRGLYTDTKAYVANVKAIYAGSDPQAVTRLACGDWAHHTVNSCRDVQRGGLPRRSGHRREGPRPLAPRRRRHGRRSTWRSTHLGP